MKKAYVTASKAEQHRQKGDYCKQQAAIALFNGDLQEAKKYEEWATLQYGLAVESEESRPDEQA